MHQQNNDSIKNGLALSPTFHRAFNRGLISISNNYKVLVHPKLKDFKPGSGIRQFENQKIYLPANEKFYPTLFSLREHRNRFGFNGLFSSVKRWFAAVGNPPAPFPTTREGVS